ncbi:hypothetical protein KJ742_06505 [Patescibacteria group bacterium]|nr:hypothetical protein [Patescibacteria group bacterium]MBU1683563.1 hypothetical protein [Patescibacteria group bacterium]MBU1935652.1 hypothetical protein [Patescibacteria group bacterium]
MAGEAPAQEPIPEAFTRAVKTGEAPHGLIEMAEWLKNLEAENYEGLLDDEKDKIRERIDELNKIIENSLKSLTTHATLNEEELETAITLIDEELSRLEETYLPLIGGGTGTEQFRSASDALTSLLADLNTFIEDDLRTFLNQTDLANADIEAARLRIAEKTGRGTDVLEDVRLAAGDRASRMQKQLVDTDMDDMGDRSATIGDQYVSRKR